MIGRGRTHRRRRSVPVARRQRHTSPRGSGAAPTRCPRQNDDQRGSHCRDIGTPFRYIPNLLGTDQATVSYTLSYPIGAWIEPLRSAWSADSSPHRGPFRVPSTPAATTTRMAPGSSRAHRGSRSRTHSNALIASRTLSRTVFDALTSPSSRRVSRGRRSNAVDAASTPRSLARQSPGDLSVRRWNVGAECEGLGAEDLAARKCRRQPISRHRVHARATSRSHVGTEADSARASTGRGLHHPRRQVDQHRRRPGLGNRRSDISTQGPTRAEAGARPDQLARSLDRGGPEPGEISMDQEFASPAPRSRRAGRPSPRRARTGPRMRRSHVPDGGTRTRSSHRPIAVPRRLSTPSASISSLRGRGPSASSVQGSLGRRDHLVLDRLAPRRPEPHHARRARRIAWTKGQ